MDPFEDAMNKALQKLAVDIIPSDEDLRRQNDCADQIIKLLQRKSKFNIGRVCVAGSMGKKTTIVGSDNDLVLFVNDEEPSFKDVLKDFRNILNRAGYLNIKNLRKTKYSIQFTAQDIEFDVLPAANFTKGFQGDNLIDIQQQRVLKNIERDPNKYGYMYSSSLAEASIRFMKQQDGFVNEMVRLAKLWYKTLHFNRIYVSGAKNFIELIAVYAANQEPRMETKSYLRSFRRFINYLQDFNRLNIHFEANEHQVLNKDRPRVMDPVNPYNNLAKEWDPKSIQLVKRYANEANQRLQFLEFSRTVCLDLLFELQQDTKNGTLCQDMLEIFGGKPTESEWLVGIAKISSQPYLEVRDEDLREDESILFRLEMLKMYFQITIIASRASGYDEYQIKKVVRNMIDKKILDEERTWSDSNRKHDDYDVTFTFPVSDQNAIRISYRL